MATASKLPENELKSPAVPLFLTTLSSFSMQSCRHARGKAGSLGPVKTGSGPSCPITPRPPSLEWAQKFHAAFSSSSTQLRPALVPALYDCMPFRVCLPAQDLRGRDTLQEFSKNKHYCHRNQISFSLRLQLKKACLRK